MLFRSAWRGGVRSVGYCSVLIAALAAGCGGSSSPDDRNSSSNSSDSTSSGGGSGGGGGTGGGSASSSSSSSSSGVGGSTPGCKDPATDCPDDADPCTVAVCQDNSCVTMPVDVNDNDACTDDT